MDVDASVFLSTGYGHTVQRVAGFVQVDFGWTKIISGEFIMFCVSVRSLLPQRVPLRLASHVGYFGEDVHRRGPWHGRRVCCRLLRAGSKGMLSLLYGTVFHNDPLLYLDNSALILCLHRDGGGQVWHPHPHHFVVGRLFSRNFLLGHMDEACVTVNEYMANTFTFENTFGAAALASLASSPSPLCRWAIRLFSRNFLLGHIDEACVTVWELNEYMANTLTFENTFGAAALGFYLLFGGLSILNLCRIPPS